MTASGVVSVSLLYFEGCPNWRVADERLREALARVGQPDAPIEYLTVTTPEQAEELRFRGSPTVLVNGRDPFLDGDAPDVAVRSTSTRRHRKPRRPPLPSALSSPDRRSAAPHVDRDSLAHPAACDRM